jgi:hypothetical protein
LDNFYESYCVHGHVYINTFGANGVFGIWGPQNEKVI